VCVCVCVCDFSRINSSHTRTVKETRRFETDPPFF